MLRFAEDKGNRMDNSILGAFENANPDDVLAFNDMKKLEKRAADLIRQPDSEEKSSNLKIALLAMLRDGNEGQKAFFRFCDDHNAHLLGLKIIDHELFTLTNDPNAAPTFCLLYTSSDFGAGVNKMLEKLGDLDEAELSGLQGSIKNNIQILVDRIPQISRQHLLDADLDYKSSVTPS